MLGFSKNKEKVNPNAITLESLYKMKFNLRQVNNLFRLADVDIDPNDKESFRENKVNKDISAMFLTELDVVNSVDVKVGLIDDEHSHEFINFQKKLQQVKTELSQKAHPQKIPFSVIWAELVKTFFKFGKILDLDDKSIFKSWLAFRTELIQLITENGLQDKSKVLKCVLNFIGQLEKDGHTLSARAIHNFIYIVRKTMLANFARNKEMDAMAYAVLAGPCLLFALELESTMILANANTKFDPSFKSTREYIHMRLLISTLIDSHFFDKPFEPSLYQFFYQHDAMPSLDAIASLSMLNELDTRERSGTQFQNLQSLVGGVDFKESDMTATQLEMDLNERFQQLLLTSSGQTLSQFDTEQPKAEKGVSASFLTTTGTAFNVKKRGSMVKQDSMLPQYMMQNVRDIFQETQSENMNPTVPQSPSPVSKPQEKQKM
ncbi:MAG: hypothetical protein HYX61_10630 [Gammaproteobacteria bacterium]|nr:hypothetical protein [Gammaproteobacteria bacterium]